jgi:LL-diaminopimelate aminotransferase
METNSQIAKTAVKPAERTNHVTEYYFSRKRKEIEHMKESGLDVIELGIGSPDRPPSGNVIEALHSNALKPGNHGYQSYTGIQALRAGFSVWYKKYFNVELDPSGEILPLIGSKEGIMHISMAFINDGDEVLVPDPGYPAYAAATKLAGGNVRYYDLTEENGWLPDLDRIEAGGVENVKIMWINYPHMPTGKRASKNDFCNLVAFARKHNILLCNDNPYSFILNNEYLSILSVEGAKDIALEMNSLSKSHNMAGWRIGMVAGNKEYINAILKVKSNMDSGMFQPMQAAAAEALNAPDEWYDVVNEAYKKRRKVAEEIMASLGCRFDEKQSGLFLWGKIPSYYQNSEELTELLLHKANVFITPGFIFGKNGNNYIRISLCATEEVLNNALNRIKTVIN